MQVHKGAAQLADSGARLRPGQLLLQDLRPDDAVLLLLYEKVVELLQVLLTHHPHISTAFSSTEMPTTCLKSFQACRSRQAHV